MGKFKNFFLQIREKVLDEQLFVQVEIVPSSTSKGIALKYIVEKYLNQSMQNVFAYGDTMNDPPMLEMVGHGYLVSNCAENTKEWLHAYQKSHDNVHLSGHERAHALLYSLKEYLNLP